MLPMKNSLMLLAFMNPYMLLTLSKLPRTICNLVPGRQRENLQKWNTLLVHNIIMGIMNLLKMPMKTQVKT